MYWESHNLAGDNCVLKLTFGQQKGKVESPLKYEWKSVFPIQFIYLIEIYILGNYES